MKCEKCGQEVPEGMNFCNNCGTPISLSSQPAMKMKYIKCNSCGALCQPDSVFCDNCGKPLNNKKDNKKYLLLVIILLLILASIIVVYVITHNKSNSVNEDPPIPSSETNDSSNSMDSENKSVSYTIICKDEAGATLDKEVKQGIIGEQVNASAYDIDGYTPRSNQQKIELSEDPSDNIIVFLYDYNQNEEEDNDEEINDEEIEVNVEYSVICIDGESDEILQRKSFMGKSGTSITISAPYIDGYSSYDDEMAITLSKDESQNVLTFYYEEVEDINESTMNIPEYNTMVFNGHTYFAYRTSDIDSFWEAQIYCEDMGGYLAVINDASENTALYDYVFKQLGYESAYFGFTDEGSEGDWYWTGSHGSSNYTNWLNGQPDNSRNVEHYALFYYKDTPYKWNDADFGKDEYGTVTFLIEWDTDN